MNGFSSSIKWEHVNSYKGKWYSLRPSMGLLGLSYTRLASFNLGYYCYKELFFFYIYSILGSRLNALKDFLLDLKY